MIRKPVFRSRFLAWGIIAAFVLLVTPVSSFARQQTQQAQQTQQPPRTYVRQGAIRGVVFSEGMRTRISGAIVKVRNLNNQKEFLSQHTDAKGNYRILAVEEGWYTLTVTTAAGDFNLNYGIYIKAGETARLSVEMVPGGMLEGKGGGAGGRSFFGTPGGVLLIVALVGGGGFGVWQLTKKEEEASPIR